ncbi:MAG: ABC transporter permease subunit [Verrucomicrobiales bacterium]|nr:ABC transporter permease subunit [Verrucomicrobiales bacterium]
MSERVAELRRSREKSLFLRVSALLVGGGIIWAWFSSRPLLGRLSAERRWENFKNFAGELVPSPVRKSGDWSEAGPWAWDLLTDEGFLALMTTLGIATAAIILSATFVLPLLPFASRQLSRPDPFGMWAGRSGTFRVWVRRIVGPVTRFGFVLARAVPEYIVAFLLIALLGLQVWPLVLALAIHNLGILGRLWGEVVENAEPAAAEHALAAGQSRNSVFLSRIYPANFNRFLIYFFYRWETCVKDATVLGMLGLLTLGKLIALSKGFFWDQMFFYILLGASVILIGDLFSTFLRRRLR